MAEADPGNGAPVLLFDLMEALRRVLDEVHLVDHHGHATDAERRDDVAVAASLTLSALPGVDQN